MLLGFALSISIPTYAQTTTGFTLQRDSIYTNRYYLAFNGSRDHNHQIMSKGTIRIDLVDHGVSNVKEFGVYVQHPDFGQVMGYESETHNLGVGTIYLNFSAYPEIEIEYESPTGQYLNLTYENSNTDLQSTFSSPGDTVKIFFTFSEADTIRPAINGQENFVTNVDDPKTVDYFKSFLRAIDETDGDISNQIYVITDNYTTNKTIVGRYMIKFGVKDAANNESTIEVYVNVVDAVSPVISGNSAKVQISYKQTWNIAAFKSSLTVSDNYYTLSHSDIGIKSDGYTANKTNLGTYSVEFEVTDGSGNKGTFVKQVEVIDDIAPVFSGHSVLTKNNNQTLTVNEIKAGLTAHDEKEGNKTSQIVVKTDGYTGNGHRVGSYQIVFEVADSKGNKATHTVTVNVVDNLPPVWYIEDGVSIKIVQPATLTREQMIDLLTKTGQITVTSTTSFNFILDEYQGNETIPGVYAMAFRLKDTAGNEQVHNFAITVLEDDTDDDTVVLEPTGNFLDNTIQFIKDNTLMVSIISGVIIVSIIAVISLKSGEYKPRHLRKNKYSRFRRK